MNVVAFAGYSGSGKTTLVESLIPALKLRGLRVSVVKHAHHKFDIDHPGKDTLPAPRGRRLRGGGGLGPAAGADARVRAAGAS